MAPPTRPNDTARMLDMSSEEYRHVFEIFLAGTDQKELSGAYLDRLAGELPRRRVFLDIGAGRGDLARHMTRHFERVVAVEPSAPMRDALRRACPDALILPDPVNTVRVEVTADLAVCAHVLYHLPPADWAATVQRMLRWVAPGGELVVMLQNPDNDCMRMVRHFTGARFDLGALASRLEAGAAGLLADCRLETLPSTYRATAQKDVLAVAELLLTVPGLRALPARRRLREYVRREFSTADGGFRIRHDQDVLRLRRA
ncbi:class I SAM-dependent methyltransferase [Streptomyces sp. AV19]|uniref:class I SAM-dependent methyltransferase n=1 Tax=Streptomyces sp. AV19 TaxID=2793068 RepID=UPI0018FE430B|nr:class I SAM-dependent methyltransferase [Streptomyces sp. AV19]MBH1935949.1 class I SAM-dependent methyltransferase [Streptomyces sp. AV19]MDG4534262.1 class I SAM-dependent methyltransferase [Streptomyces sp. AV19]